MKKLLFVISQLYKGGAETSLVNLLNRLDPKEYETDLLILNQCPVRDAVSMIPMLAPHVRVCNAYGTKGKNSFWNRVKGRFFYKKAQKERALISALNFVRKKEYDWAFAVGEWSDPDFVALEVMAKHKALWIHNDLSLCEYFDSDRFFSNYDLFDKAIFVSQNSLQESVKAYPFLRKKATVIYNINDAKKIIENSSLSIGEDEKLFSDGLPTLVTCANFRKQKNHLRQVDVMAELKRRGIDFRWINIGALSDVNLVSNVQSKIAEEGLEDRFLILGAKKNPYPYFAKATAVAVLSDYESWSMVITEAKILGIPVISTKTSGALEQISHKETGVLADFSVLDIADQIEIFLKDSDLQAQIRRNISGFDNSGDVLNAFHDLVYSEIELVQSGNRILYIIDDINYAGGAHIATKYQINYLLSKGQDVSIFSHYLPSVKIRNEFCGVDFLSWEHSRLNWLYSHRLFGVLFDPRCSKFEKKYKLKMTLQSKIRRNPKVFPTYVLDSISDIFSKYDTICVMSEGSGLKKQVGTSSAKNKIQWIHTDYCLWRQLDSYAKEISADDGETWKSYSKIVVLTESIRSSMANLYPHLAEKLIVEKNMIPVDWIRSMAVLKNEQPVHFITVGRLEHEKAYERLFRVLGKLFAEGYRFDWRIVGDGSERYQIQEWIFQNSLQGTVILEGNSANPFRLVKKADVFALLSEREGLPNTIYEALILGIPVLATNVGGISEQVVNGETGWLIRDDETEIYHAIRHILDHPDEIREIKEKLKTYSYDNTTVCNGILQIFDVHDD